MCGALLLFGVGTGFVCATVVAAWRTGLPPGPVSSSFPARCLSVASKNAFAKHGLVICLILAGKNGFANLAGLLLGLIGAERRFCERCMLVLFAKTFFAAINRSFISSVFAKPSLPAKIKRFSSSPFAKAFFGAKGIVLRMRSYSRHVRKLGHGAGLGTPCSMAR